MKITQGQKTATVHVNQAGIATDHGKKSDSEQQGKPRVVVLAGAATCRTCDTNGGPSGK